VGRHIWVYCKNTFFKPRRKVFLNVILNPLSGSTAVPSPSRLAVFGPSIYFTDSTKQGLLSIDKYSGPNSLQTIYRNRTLTRDPRGVSLLSPLTQPSVPNPCSFNNGLCEQLCVVTKSQDKLAYECACQLGYHSRLDDPKKCEKTYEFLLYTQHKFVRAQKISPVTPANFKDALSPVVSRSARFVGLDFDAHKGFVYYSDVLQDVIYRSSVEDGKREIVLAAQNEGVEGLAFDWVGGNLYYIDSKEGTLSVLKVKKGSGEEKGGKGDEKEKNKDQGTRKVLLKGLKRPRAIVVHPLKGINKYRPCGLASCWVSQDSQEVLTK